MGRSTKSITLLRDLVRKFEQLSADAESRNDHRSATEANKQKLYAVEKLLEYEQAAQKVQLQQTTEDGTKRIPMELMDSIMDSVAENYDPCPRCGAYSLPKASQKATGEITGWPQ